MIKPQELRIGNIVTINNPDFHKKMKDIPVMVNGINLKRDNYFPASEASISVTDGKFSYSQFNEFIEPINLTEEWLIKFGFIRQPWGLVIGKLLFKDKNHECKELTLEVGNGFRTTVTYVHQLQNLFHSLTGEELTIKE